VLLGLGGISAFSAQDKVDGEALTRNMNQLSHMFYHHVPVDDWAQYPVVLVLSLEQHNLVMEHLEGVSALRFFMDGLSFGGFVLMC